MLAYTNLNDFVNSDNSKFKILDLNKLFIDYSIDDAPTISWGHNFSWITTVNYDENKQANITNTFFSSLTYIELTSFDSKWQEYLNKINNFLSLSLFVLLHNNDILAYSYFAMKAMTLGVPSVKINTFVGRIFYFEGIDNKCNLGYEYLPFSDNEHNFLDKVKYLASNNGIENIWNEEKEKMLSEKCVLNKWMIDYFDKAFNT